MSKDAFPFLKLNPFSIAKSKKFLNSVMQKIHCPLLLTAGTYPYEKACVPCVEHINIQHSIETAFEIAASLQNEITALIVNPSKYISTDEDVTQFEALKKDLNDLSSMYKMSLNKKSIEGNPVKSITSALIDFNLLITGAAGLERRNWFTSLLNPDVVWHIVRKSCISVLLLPKVKELL